MQMRQFPVLSGRTLFAVNTVGQWLAQNDFSGEQPYSSDCVILAGNAVIPTIDAACRIAKAQGVPLLISGGIGHSTPFLYAAIARHPRYNIIRTTGRTEAAILADIANQFWHIPAEKIWVEDQSTNCGENARFSCALLRQAKESINTAIVVQDPTMQRRTMATFRRVTGDDIDAPRWLSFPGFIPELCHLNDGTDFVNAEEGVWTVERYLSLIAGELPRLRDDETGYGPRGKNFIIHVDIPQDVETAWHILQSDTTLCGIAGQRVLR
ncbi:YdcF family protein [Salmonella bongori]|uniref:Protein ydcF n=3 Tax=Salmonella bongori TaxID=54736 RepID=S5MW23_SALBN|nr:Protein ydcF [Salmonella bongori N268-08]ECC8734542.1 YdcF family protein [Salmonella bongori]ECG8259782.1 YdcF family protein [Salmonella bongori serovar 48:i:-]EGE4654823.1 YdcF family protein [Salmonella bongori serovar 40:z35:- str. 95-0123]EGE4660113.1 YdcF family protein [Salmonella bongori serovar 48:i:- str. 94-0708]EIZ4347554.1 YdcF family protein [Salmonella bongori serovar 48:z81:-]QGF77291.1 YdcF family protein [Salmonella bongori CFSAN000510]QVP39353.1 YdcF family protein [Sa